MMYWETHEQDVLADKQDVLADTRTGCTGRRKNRMYRQTLKRQTD